MAESKEQMGPGLFAMGAEFKSADELLAATRKTYGEGYRKIDACSPFPIHHLAEAMGFEKNGVPWLSLTGGILGAIGGYAMQYFASVIHYPHNIGGRPYHSWPAFVPITFETTVLLTGFFTVFGMLILNGYPRPYHPYFNVERFERVTKDGFFLFIDATDDKFDRQRAEEFLKSLNPQGVFEVPK